MLLPGEQDAIDQVTALAEQYGYGNLISRLRDAWSKKLQQTEGLSVVQADIAAFQICAWCHIDARTGKEVKTILEKDSQH